MHLLVEVVVVVGRIRFNKLATLLKAKYLLKVKTNFSNKAFEE